MPAMNSRTDESLNDFHSSKGARGSYRDNLDASGDFQDSSAQDSTALPKNRHEWANQNEIRPDIPEAVTYSSGQQNSSADRNGSFNDIRRHSSAAGTTGKPGTAMALVRFLENSSTSKDLVIEAGQHLFDQATTRKRPARLLRKVLASSGLWTFGEDLHGNQAVTKSVRDQSHLPAHLLSASTLLDFVGAVGLFKFIFQSASLGWFVPTIIFSGGLLFISKHCGSGMINRLRSNSTASVATGAFLAVASLQSLTTGAGVFLFNGQHKVVNYYASELVAADFQRRRERISSLRDPANSLALSADEATCAANTKQLNSPSTNKTSYQQLSVETFGLWEDRRVAPSNQPRWVLQNWPRERWPICHRSAANRAELQRKINQETRELEQLQVALQEAPSAATFLRKLQPEIFAEHFRVTAHGDMELRDSLRAGSAAWSFFWAPPEGDRNEIALVILVMWVSIGSSAAAFLCLLRYSHEDETKMSFSEACGHHRAELLSVLQQRLPEEIYGHLHAEEGFRSIQNSSRHRIRLEEIDKLSPEFQTLAYLSQNGCVEVQRLARQQYYERLVDLFVQRSNETGEIDYAYIANRVKRHWEDIKAAGMARVTPHGTSGPDNFTD